MPFGVVNGVSRGMGVLHGVVIVEGKEAVLGVNLGHPIVTSGTLLHSCVEVREPIELSFGVMSGVSLCIRVLDGIQVPQREGKFWSFSPPLASMAYFSHRNVFDLCVKTGQYLHTDNGSLESAFHWCSKDTVKFEKDVGFVKNMQKCNTHFGCRSSIAATQNLT